MVDVTIDSRETKAKEFFAGLIDRGVSPQIDKLDTGDFHIFGRTENDSVLIERKTASDFLQSIEGKKIAKGHWEKGRIWDQLKRMKETKIKERVVLIEGNPFNKRLSAYRKKGFTKTRIWGAMRAIRRWGAGIERTKDIEETLDYIAYVAKSKKKPKKPFALRTSPPKSMTLREKKLYFIQGLPGVGPKTAKKILKEGSLKKFFVNIHKSSAVGKVAKKEIRKILN